jgi:hypothetical protein
MKPEEKRERIEGFEEMAIKYMSARDNASWRYEVCLMQELIEMSGIDFDTVKNMTWVVGGREHMDVHFHDGETACLKVDYKRLDNHIKYQHSEWKQRKRDEAKAA